MSFVSLGIKMLFRGRGTLLSIVIVPLSIATLTSMNATVNYINFQASEMGELVNVGKTYLILSKNSTSILDSRVEKSIVKQLESFQVEDIFPQKVLLVSLSSNNTILIRGVSNVSLFLKARNAYLNGSIAKFQNEVNVGEILANLFSIKVGEELKLSSGEKTIDVKVVGIFRTFTQEDTEFLTPIETLSSFSNDGSLSFIEFKTNNEEIIANISQILPKDVKIVKAQQLRMFLEKT